MGVGFSVLRTSCPTSPRVADRCGEPTGCCSAKSPPLTRNRPSSDREKRASFHARNVGGRSALFPKNPLSEERTALRQRMQHCYFVDCKLICFLHGLYYYLDLPSSCHRDNQRAPVRPIEDSGFGNRAELLMRFWENILHCDEVGLQRPLSSLLILGL